MLTYNPSPNPQDITSNLAKLKEILSSLSTEEELTVQIACQNFYQEQSKLALQQANKMEETVELVAEIRFLDQVKAILLNHLDNLPKSMEHTQPIGDTEPHNDTE